jgi:dolichyl-phosphate-mannose--protein O-mannosyl transferase
MTPFGWRFSGTFFGTLMLPLLYVFLKKLFGGRLVPSLGTILFAADFMHYVQTRIATIDTYSVFFILLMYLFLYLWLSEDKLWALALCGVSFGLGAAAKWTSIYAGAGLALLWAAHWVLRFVKAGKALPQAAAGRGKVKGQAAGLFPAFVQNVLFCLVFFIAVPLLIYYVSYLPYGRARGVSLFSRDYLRIVLDNQKYMFNYHSGVKATHHYSSVWWQWVLDIRPILYFLEYSPGNVYESSIGCWLNPLLCWGGLLAMVCMVYEAAAERDRAALFILIGYLAQLVPWLFVKRVVFEYHYFPSSVFLVMALGHIFRTIERREPQSRYLVVSFAAVSVVLFAAFYPELSGLTVPRWYDLKLLKWLPTWPF